MSLVVARKLPKWRRERLVGERIWVESHKFRVEWRLERNMRAFTHYMSTLMRYMRTLTDNTCTLTGDTRALMDDMGTSKDNRRTFKRDT